MSEKKEANLIETSKEELLNRIVSKIRDHEICKYISAVIISGSFGRGEPTYRISEGKVIYESDMEMALAYKTFYDRSKLKKWISSIISCFPEIELELMTISVSRLIHKRNYNFTILNPKKLTLFTYDFYKGSKTLYGNEYLDKEVYVNEIDVYEGKRLLGNRIAELEYNKRFTKNNREINRWLAKTVLAIGTSALILNGEYVSSYYSQYERVMSSDSIEKIFDHGFIELYRCAYLYLREGSADYCFMEKEEIIRKYVGIEYERYLKMGITHSSCNCLYIFVRETIFTLLRAPQIIWHMFNLKNYIYDKLFMCYIANSDEIIVWAKRWKQILNNSK